MLKCEIYVERTGGVFLVFSGVTVHSDKCLSTTSPFASAERGKARDFKQSGDRICLLASTFYKTSFEHLLTLPRHLSYRHLPPH